MDTTKGHPKIPTISNTSPRLSASCLADKNHIYQKALTVALTIRDYIMLTTEDKESELRPVWLRQ
jgi:hypothetical protein